MLLTHWSRVTHICVGKLIIIGSDSGLSPGRRQAIIWTSAGILLIGPLRTNFSENSTEILTFSFTKMRLKMSSAKWRPFCPGLNVLKGVPGRHVITYRQVEFKSWQNISGGDSLWNCCHILDGYVRDQIWISNLCRYFDDKVRYFKGESLLIVPLNHVTHFMSLCFISKFHRVYYSSQLQINS